MSSTLAINSNIASLNTQRRLASSTKKLEASFERLSSGLRINRASDDAAGLAISSSLSTDARVYSQATRNVNDAVSYYSIASGALNSLSTIAVRLEELAEQSSNGTVTFNQRRALDAEAQALAQEYRRISWTTQFNSQNLFENSNGALAVQAGYAALSLSGGLAPSGTFLVAQTYSMPIPGAVQVSDVSGDGIFDIVVAEYTGATANVSILIGNGNGSFSARVTYALSGNQPRSIHLADTNGDGINDIISTASGTRVNVLLGNGNGTFQANKSFGVGGIVVRDITSGDYNEDGNLDLATVDVATGVLTLLAGNGNGTFKAHTTLALPSISTGILTSDFNFDGNADLLIADNSVSSVSIHFGNGNGTFLARRSLATSNGPSDVALGDVNGDGRQDIVVTEAGFNDIAILLANGDGTFLAKRNYSAGVGPQTTRLLDANGDGRLDLFVAYGGSSVDIMLGNGDGAFRAPVSYSTGLQSYTNAAADVNGDGRVDLITADGNSNQMSILLGNGESVGAYAPTVGFHSLLDQQGAKEALTELKKVRSFLNGAIGQLGANESRLTFVSTVLSTARENYLAASSQISDVDVAHESADLVRTQILQQAGSAVLAQANIQPQIALQLLQGV